MRGLLIEVEWQRNDRDQRLFEEAGWRPFCVPRSPNLFWPSDHAWCVATEIDLLFTLVAGTNGWPKTS